MNNQSESIKNRDQKDDYSLVRDFHKGDMYAFDHLVLRYKDRIFNLCFRFLGDYQDAEDTTQDVFVKAYRSLKNFRSESSFFTWLYRIAVNTCKNKIKSLEYRFRKADAKIDISEETADGIQAVYRPYLNGGPAAYLENKEMMRTLQKAIKSLPSDQRTVVILRDIQGLSYEEIAEITGFKLGTLKSRLSRARGQLREKIGGVI